MARKAKFRGDLGFLSNFYPSLIIYNNVDYRSSEHLFQSLKAKDPDAAERIRVSDFKDVKKLGRVVEAKDNWDQIRVAVMFLCLQLKFEQNYDLMKDLLNTNNYDLVEENDWGDKFWGVCDGEGENMLGKLLLLLKQLELGKSI